MIVRRRDISTAQRTAALAALVPEPTDPYDHFYFPSEADAGLPRAAKTPSAKELALGLGLALAPMAPGSTAPGTPQELPTPPAAEGWSNYQEAVDNAADKYQIPREMFQRLLETENDTGNPHAVSPAGAVGLAQFMPGTADELGIDPENPGQSIDAAAKYLSELHHEFGDWGDVLRAYNWGAGNVRRWLAEGGELPAETKHYVQKILPGVESAVNNLWLERRGADSLFDDLLASVAGTSMEAKALEAFGLFGAEDALIGLYWYCANYHGGQGSDEYRVLSALSDVYKPGALANGPEPDSGEEMAYEFFGGNRRDNGEIEDQNDATRGPSDDPNERA